VQFRFHADDDVLYKNQTGIVLKINIVSTKILHQLDIFFTLTKLFSALCLTATPAAPADVCNCIQKSEWNLY